MEMTLWNTKFKLHYIVLR